MASGIYTITNGANGKKYVGSAVCFDSRKGQHLRALTQGVHHSIKLQRAWNKHGAGVFTFNLLLVCAKEDLIFYEQRAIDIFSAVEGGYNVAPRAGSTLGVLVTEETRVKLSKAHLGRVKTKEHQAKITAALTGKKRTEAEAARLRGLAVGNKNCLGRVASEATRKRMSEAHKGVPIPEEQRKKISEALKGRKRVFTPEHLANLAKAVAKRGLDSFAKLG